MSSEATAPPGQVSHEPAPLLNGIAATREPGQHPEKDGSDESLSVGNHVVCLVDVMGQEDRLKAWPKMPPDSLVPPEFIEVLRGTTGIVLGIRDEFVSFFGQLADRQPDERIGSLPVEQRALYRRFLECRVSVQQFSDTFVFHAPMWNEHGDVPTIAVYRMLAACCMAMVFALAREIPLRGAITIGMGAELEAGNFYGPALGEVHHLESKVAGYPRILVSEMLRDFVYAGKEYSRDPNMEPLMRQLMGSARTFITRDYDGRWIVDFAGPGLRELMGAASADVLAMAYGFARAEAERFTRESNQKLAERYARLLAYLGPRLRIWGLEETH